MVTVSPAGQAVAASATVDVEFFDAEPAGDGGTQHRRLIAVV
jgi:hypothetical protein